MDKPELTRGIAEAHERMADAIGRLSDEQLSRLAMEDWTGKDLVAHMAWWHDNSVRVIGALRAGSAPYDTSDPENATDALNKRTRGEHLDDPTDLVRQEFKQSFSRLLSALDPVTDEELFGEGHWPWLGGEALVEMILWDTARHYDGHRANFETLAHKAD